jgi:hypothetical protein
LLTIARHAFVAFERHLVVFLASGFQLGGFGSRPIRPRVELGNRTIQFRAQLSECARPSRPWCGALRQWTPTSASSHARSPAFSARVGRDALEGARIQQTLEHGPETAGPWGRRVVASGKQIGMDNFVAERPRTRARVVAHARIQQNHRLRSGAAKHAVKHDALEPASGPTSASAGSHRTTTSGSVPSKYLALIAAYCFINAGIGRQTHAGFEDFLLTGLRRAGRRLWWLVPGHERRPDGAVRADPGHRDHGADDGGNTDSKDSAH